MNSIPSFLSTQIRLGQTQVITLANLIIAQQDTPPLLFTLHSKTVVRSFQVSQINTIRLNSLCISN